MQKMKPSYGVGLGNKPPTMDKLLQLIGIVLLFLVSLSGSEDILGKKRAQLTVYKTILLQIDRLDQRRKCKLCITSLNSHFA